LNVFLTGASSGLGEALARHYAARGAVVGMFARRAGELARITQSLPGRTIEAYPGDVRDAAVLRAAAADFLQRHGAPDVVIANAGVSRGVLTDHPEDIAVFRDVLETNVLGMVHTFGPFLPAMRARRAGALVGIASVAGFRGLPGSGAYSASKAAAMAYLESLRVELRGSGIAVVTVCPGYIATPMTARNPYRMPFMLRADVAARRIARAVAGRRRFYVLPWPMALVARAMRALPRGAYDRMFANAPRKPRDAG
jgi:short-subunit dehydrogenase